MAAQTHVTQEQQWQSGTAGYADFSTLPLQAIDTSVMATPLLAQTWAEAIVAYWQHLVSQQRINCEQPLYVLDLNPGSGQFAWLLLKALRTMLADSPLQPCYLACSSQLDVLEKLSRHPYLLPSIEQRCFDTALLHPTYNSLHLQQQNQTLLRSENPIVVIGLGHFQSLASELFAVHHGKILQGRVSSDSARDDAGNYPLEYQWDEVEPSATAAPLLEYYCKRCNSNALLLPVAACAQLDGLSRIAAGRYLLLTADSAVCTEQAIRLGALNPPATMSDAGITIPVNLHALHLHQQQQGATSWHQQLSNDGVSVFLAGKDGDNTMPLPVFEHISEILSATHPDDMRQQLNNLPVSAAHGLSLLRRSHYAPLLLKTFIQSLIDGAGIMEHTLRLNWQQALTRTMQNYFPPGSYDSFCYQAGLLAIHLGDFGFARKCLHFSLDCYGDDATELYLLAHCDAHTGSVTQALELLEQALALNPEHPHALALRDSLQQRLAQWQHNTRYLPQLAQADELQLEPLGHQHAPALLYQYRDQQIGIMACLPQLDTVEQAQEWISEQQQQPERASFAVMHQHWGFVGSVSIHCAGDAGYFCFWIGSDFQNLGLGQQAAKLLFGMMAAQGVTQIFTSAYQDNARSIHALTRLGFEKLEIKAKEPDENLEFFYLGLGGEQRDDAKALRDALFELCQAIESPLEIV